MSGIGGYGRRLTTRGRGRGRPAQGRARQKGLTLAEVMVALLIFSLIAASSVYALRLGVESRDQLEAADDELKRLQLARLLIKEDLAQITPRPARDEFGIAPASVFFGGEVVFSGRREDDERILLSFVRGGWVNPGAVSPRSALQHVEYVFTGGALVRRARAFVDETQASEGFERVLFDNLDEAYTEFLVGEVRGDLDWADAWPLDGAVIGGAGGGADASLPRAVALVMRMEEGAPLLRQYFWLGELGLPGGGP